MVNAYITDGTTKIYFTSINKESSSDSGKTTTNPVESGANISDNYIINPRSFRVQGRISGIADAYVTINKIRQMMKSKKLLKYVGKEVFDNCLIISFPKEKIKEYGNGLSFTMDLQELFIAQQETVEIIDDTANEETDASLQNSINGNTELGIILPAPIALLESEQIETELVAYFDSVGDGSVDDFFSGTQFPSSYGGIL